MSKVDEGHIAIDELRLLGSAFQVAGQGIAILTPSDEATGPRIAFVNHGFCNIYGVTPAEIIGKTVVTFGIVERHQAIFTDMLQHIFNHEIFDGEATAHRKDGGEFELDLQVIPVEDSGRLTHWVAFLRDITDSKNQLLLLRRQATYDGPP